MNLFKDQSSYAKPQAQMNLAGRTHYVDDASLRFHHSRILRTVITDNGLLLGIVESCSLDMNNTRRGFRPVVFDVFGTVVNNRASLKDCYKTRKAAEKAMWAELTELDAYAHTLAAINRQEQQYISEMEQMRIAVHSLATKQKAA